MSDIDMDIDIDLPAGNRYMLKSVEPNQSINRLWDSHWFAFELLLIER